MRQYGSDAGDVGARKALAGLLSRELGYTVAYEEVHSTCDLTLIAYTSAG